jgi:hypothetical protein
MELWKCPKCSDTIRAKAAEVAHRCPSNKQKWTNYQQVQEKT